MSVKVNLIPPDQIDEVWPDAEPLIAKAVKLCRGETNTQHVHDNLVEGNTKLLAFSDGGMLIAAVVICMHQYPEKKVCMISLAGGTRMSDWADQGLAVVEKIAKEAGADAVYVHGRKGWLRKFSKYGYKEYSTLMGKDLEG